MTTPAAIGSLIRDARKQRGLTQQQLADVLSTSQSAIHRIEAGNQNLSLEMVNKIAEALESPLIARADSRAMNFRIQGEAKLSGSTGPMPRRRTVASREKRSRTGSFTAFKPRMLKFAYLIVFLPVFRNFTEKPVPSPYSLTSKMLLSINAIPCDAVAFSV